MVIIVFLTLYFAILANSEEHSKAAESCVDKFCPMGTYCETRYIAECAHPPCRPLLVCTPDSANGCKSHPGCPSGQVCVERTIPCIGRSCKKVAKCAPIGTCEALVCPPSHKCIEDPKPACVKTIMTADDIADMIRQATNK